MRRKAGAEHPFALWIAALALVGGCGEGKRLESLSDGGVDSAEPPSPGPDSAADSRLLGGSEAGAPVELDGGRQDGPGSTDRVAPTIVSTSPTDGAKGVRADASVEFRFSEPMDRGSVEAAIQSAEFARAQLTFEWSENDSRIRVKPAAPFAYASGTAGAVTARTYTFAVGSAAKDVAGNPLMTPVSVRFSTLRKLTAHPDLIPELTGSARYCLSCGAGDFLGSSSSTTAQYLLSPGEINGPAFLSFDLKSLPRTLIAVESASISIFEQGGSSGRAGVPVYADSLSFSALDATAVTSGGRASIGQFMAADMNVEHILDATSAIRGDIENRDVRFDRSQYRLSLKRQATGEVQFGAISMAVTYLDP